MTNSEKQNFLIDGFPRNKENVDGWHKTMKDRVNIQCVLVFDCDEKVKKYILFLLHDEKCFFSAFKKTCIARCLERGKGSGRVDDNEESLKKRLIYLNIL
jgi:UMP-CMP kinase